MGARLKDINTNRDPRLLCYCAILKNQWERLGQINDPFAQIYYAYKCIKLFPDYCVAFQILRDSTDPIGIYYYGMLYRKHLVDRGNEYYRPIALKSFCTAAQLGCNKARLKYCELTPNICDKLKHLEKVIFETKRSDFTRYIEDYTFLISCNANAVWFRVGRLYARMEKWQIRPERLDIYISPERIFSNNVAGATAALNTWLQCAHWLNRQNGRILFNRDLRKLIGKLIWKSRKEGLYEIHCNYR